MPEQQLDHAQVGADRIRVLSERRRTGRRRAEILPALMQHAHHLNPVPADAIDDGIWVFPDDFMACALTHAFGTDPGISANGVRSSLDRTEHPISRGEAELRVMFFDGGDVPYRPW